MHHTRIAELLEPFLGAANDQRLTTNDLVHISTYIDLLLRWNARINLTAIRDEEEIVTRHFGESLFAARHLFPRHSHENLNAHVGTAAPGSPAERGSAAAATGPKALASDQRPATSDLVSAADLGAGAGFPGIPIKLWAPRIALTLIESNHKKATFLREVTRALTLTDINVFPGRAEQLFQGQPPQQPRPVPASPTQSYPEGFDLVTLRAVEHFAETLPVAAELVSPGGRLALLIGTRQLEPAQSLSTFSWSSPLPVPLSRARTLLVGHRHGID